MLTDGRIVLRKAKDDEVGAVWNLISKHHEWKKYDGPYFHREKLSFSSFQSKGFQKLLQGKTSLLVENEGHIVGTVSCYWECEATRWLEAGLVIYPENSWGKGIGSAALRLWIGHLFNTYEIERVGITTWSGNPGMMKCAEKAGMVLEGRMRKCRYYKGTYYDSIRYGITREEWLSES
ncbi:GNAT family N-acetyltransferase [Thiolapillus sp.]